jgi:hypothetical protein
MRAAQLGPAVGRLVRFAAGEQWAAASPRVPYHASSDWDDQFVFATWADARGGRYACAAKATSPTIIWPSVERNV